MKSESNGAREGHDSAISDTKKSEYSKPQLMVFGSVSSVTGSNMVGSFFDTMTNIANNTNMAPM
jgi:hypothetical protein